ncbi:hypothetical protein HNY73_021792 [Argiope bruennichi]|uniref:Uncharacterized protein n=1 Tax=Argiope bruennichi TaxID=94029 RepID=A0A8T0E2W9_ARGBR|nr:hypothetical protein HNY73_021792 [Argiope bruennichi]
MKVVHIATIFILHFIKSDLALTHSYIKSLSGKPSLRENQDHSSNEIPHDEIKPKYDDQHHYYLPMQTTFGSYLDPSASGASITSPPKIAPSSVHKSYDQTVSSDFEQDQFDDELLIPYLSQCISETPSNEKFESDAIISSKQFVPENHALSGHTEIVSKTSSEGDASKSSERASESSTPFQRTHIYMPSVTGLLLNS